jgi:septum formation protein
MKNMINFQTHKLYLASASPARYRLLKEAGFSFEVVTHAADEKIISYDQPLADIVLAIALQKMEHVTLPTQQENTLAYVITADTLTEDSSGLIAGKPESREEAITTLKRIRSGAQIGTAFCLERRKVKDGRWVTEQRVSQAVTMWCSLDMPDAWINPYLNSHNEAMQAAGALAVEGIGMLFFKEIKGSYSGLLGLPLAELRVALESLGFFGQQT